MWHYPTFPQALTLPACPACRNRGRVSQVARDIYVCTDCIPARPFSAVWREEPQRLPLREERVG